MDSYSQGGTKTGLHQRRPCFLCGGTTGWQLFDEIWGAGIHTSQLFAKTSILDRCRIKGIVDSDPQKWGKTIADILVSSPADIEPSPYLVIVISTCASEGEVYKATSELREQGVRVVRLYSTEN